MGARLFGWHVSMGLHVGVALAVAAASAMARIDLPPLPPLQQEVIRFPLPPAPAEGLPSIPRKGTLLRHGSAVRAPLTQPRAEVTSLAPARPPDVLDSDGPTATGPTSEGPGIGCAGCDPGGDPNASGGGGGQTGVDAPLPVRISAGVQPPRKLHQVDPVYPELARAAHVEGRVVLDCVIGVDGHVTDVHVVRGAALLSQAAVEAVEQWVYVPTLLNGRPVPVILTVTIEFHLAH